VSRAGSAASSSFGRSSGVSSPRRTRSVRTSGRRWLSWWNDSSYTHVCAPSSIVTLIATSDWRRAARQRIAVTPPRNRTASWNPPPVDARSRRNRNASRKFDLPEAFGPTRNTRSWMAASAEAKFFQFFSVIRRILIPCPRTTARSRVPLSASSSRSLGAAEASGAMNDTHAIAPSRSPRWR